MIYFLKSERTLLIKIGCTSNLANRLSNIVNVYGPVTVLGVMDGDFDAESSTQTKFRDLHVKGDWFRESPKLLEFIENNTIPYIRPFPILGRPPSKRGAKVAILGLRGYPEDKDWLQDFANHAKKSMSALVYDGLRLIAKELKFRDPPENKDTK